MTTDRVQTTLSTLLTFANGRSSPERADGLPFPVYGSNGVIGYADSANAEAGSIVIGRVGSYCGSVHFSKQRCWITDNAICATATRNNDALFLFYLLGTLNLNNWRGGSGQPLLNQDILSRIPALVPEPAEQRGIAGVLGALDDKIEQNRRTSKSLERIAREIFRAWFVDFDPVKAKAEGATSFPSMPQHVFDALATRFVDCDQGPIPEGWEVGVLDALIGERKERVGAGPLTEAMPYVPIDCIASRQIFLGSYNEGQDAKTSLVRFYTGDILFGAMRPYFHKVCIAPFAGTTRTTCFVLEPRRAVDRNYCLMLASEKATIEFATSHSVGSTIPYAKWEGSLANMPCVLATPNLRAAYGALVEPLIDLGLALERDSRKLAEMRDYLLPKLLTGQVRVETRDG